MRPKENRPTRGPTQTTSEPVLRKNAIAGSRQLSRVRERRSEAPQVLPRERGMSTELFHMGLAEHPKLCESQ